MDRIEVEAVEAALYPILVAVAKGDSIIALVGHAAHEAIAALDAVRRSPQGEDHEAGIEALVEKFKDVWPHNVAPTEDGWWALARVAHSRLSRCPSPERDTEAFDLAIERLRETGREDAASFLDDERDAILDRPSPERDTESWETRFYKDLAVVERFRDACRYGSRRWKTFDEVRSALLAEFSDTSNTDKEASCNRAV